MAFILTLVYLFLTLVPPAEIDSSLAQANPMAVLGLMAVGAGIVGVLVSSKRRRVPVQLILVAALLLWAALSVVLALQWIGGAFFTMQGLVVNLSLFWLIVLTVDTLRRLSILRAVLIVTLLVLTAMGIYDLQTGRFGGRFVMGGMRDLAADQTTPSDDETDKSADSQPTERVIIPRMMALGYLADPNHLAQVLAAVLPLLFVAWRSGRPLANLVLVGLPSALFLYGIHLTRSRGGLVALAAAVAAAGLLQRRAWLKRATLTGFLILLPIAMVMARRTARQDESSADRMEAWSYGLQLLRKSPVWGSGFGTFTESHDLTAHNSFVLCFAELGLVGYFLWLCLFVVSVQQLSEVVAWSRHDDDQWLIGRWAAAAQVSMIAFLTAAFFLSRTFTVFMFFEIGLATAVVAIARLRGASFVVSAKQVWRTTLVLEFSSIAVIYLSMRLVR